jgi:hypothetical protein
MEHQTCECKLEGRTCTKPAEYRYRGIDINRVLCQGCLNDWSARWMDEYGNLTQLWHRMWARVSRIEVA